MSGGETVCQEFAGPFVGGLLFAAGPGLALGATGIAYALAALTLLVLPGSFRADCSAAAPASITAQIAEGVRYLWHHRLLRTFTLVLPFLFRV
ncbi:hypothetical protein [Streptomyces sp. BK239]|uniref:hypothetical protein n=1 Tax=Streptomyces sp. BK239 TaxID=2512155 RepID=UPI00102D0E21|nr:hypothetical protein [Streptomyces sp. BK239]RZU14541.1 hypothetical protein EV567_4577 [Streptomyces sp. BK239]